MTEPNYWGEQIYLIRGDALELKRHLLCLADDLTFCTGHNAVHALEAFDERARRIYDRADRSWKTSMRAVVRHVQRHPLLSIVAGCACVAILGVALKPTGSRN